MNNEFRWALRRIARRRGSSAVFIVILGATLGITLSVATVARATLGAELPVLDEERLHVISESNPEQGIERMESSLASWLDWRERSRSFETIGAVRTRLNLVLSTPAEARRVSAAIVSRSMFETLGIPMELGRPFSPEEDAPGASIPTIILSHRAWVSWFGADAEVLGATILVNGESWSVVGVLGPGASLAPQSPEPIDLWTPVGMAGRLVGPPVYQNRLYRMFSLIGRSREGASAETRREDLDRVTRGLAEDHPEASEGWTWHALPLRDQVLDGVSAPISGLFGGGVLLLLVAIVNLLALYVQRVNAEARDLTTRLAVGAERSDLIRLGVVELGILGTMAGSLGILIAYVATSTWSVWLPIDLPGHVSVAFDPGVAALGLATAVATLTVVGVVGMTVSFRGLERRAASAGRVIGGSPAAHRIAQTSLTGQVALGTLLTIASVVAVRSFASLAGADPGVDPTGMTTFRVDVPTELVSNEALSVTVEEIIRELEAEPGISGTHLWAPHVPTEANWFTRVRLFDRPDVSESELPTVRFHTVSPGAVTGSGLTIVAGRDMTARDRDSGRRVVMVSESAARGWWGGPEAAVGRSLQRWSQSEWSEVVGVVEDAPLSGRQGEGSDFWTDVYFLFGQDVQRNLVFLVQTVPGASSTSSSLMRAVQRVAPDLAAYDIQSMSRRLSNQNAVARSTAGLSAVFASTAIFLGALGLYGALSSAIARSGRELGLRRALGASPLRVVRELLARRAPLVLVGIAAGTVGAWRGLRPFESTLFVAGSNGQGSYLLAMLLLVAVSFAALALPALRAVRKSPGDALRAPI